MEHLSLEIFDLDGSGSKYAALPEDTSITITSTSEIFASGDVWSHSFTINIPANAHIFGSAGELHGSRLHELVNKRRARLWVEGLPLYLGYLTLDDEVDVDQDGDVDVSFESGQKTFEEMIEGAKANQVPMMGDVEIGMALWRKRWTSFKMQLTASAVFKNGMTSLPVDATLNSNNLIDFTYDGEDDGNSIQQYPLMVFPKGHFKSYDINIPDWEENYLNTDYPYTESADGTPTHPYCNVALCYQKYGYEKKDQNGTIMMDYGGEPEAQRGYEYMPANRVNSAPNFYVIYWIRALMKHLGIYVEENQMMAVEDLRRLFFVNTKCAYEEPQKLRTTYAYDSRYGKYRYDDGGRLVPEYIDQRENRFGDVIYSVDYFPQVKADDSKFTCTEFQSSDNSDISYVDHLTIEIKGVEKWEDVDKQIYFANNNYFHKAFATSECFPNVDISDVIKAIENGFGIRFLFSDDYQRVRIVLLRNIFRNEEVQHIECDIVSDGKLENSIRGFRMTYGNTEDTHFYYKGFADKLPHKKELWVDNSDKHDYSRWNLTADYADIIQKVSAFDTTCYVTPNTGNAYGIKIDKNAKRYYELHPSLFEYAGFMDAEDGDCTGEEETIETISVGFTPAIMNDLNMDAERNDGVREQRFALFVDEQMRARRPDLNTGTNYNDADAVYDLEGKDGLYGKFGPNGTVGSMTSGDGIVKPGEFAITSDMFAGKTGLETRLYSLLDLSGKRITFNIDGHVSEGYRLYLQDNFEPNDDGVSPIMTHDWGLTLGIMRGSGSDATVKYEADPQDGEDNDTWDIVPGSNVTSHPDICDCYGVEWDYNGTLPGTTNSDNINTAEYAISKLPAYFPDSNAPFNIDGEGYITRANLITGIPDETGKYHNILIALSRSVSGDIDYGDTYIPSNLVFKSTAEMMANDAAGKCIVVEIDSSYERRDTLLKLCRIAYGGSNETMIIDDGVGSTFGRFSLKLRAEKLNPYYSLSQKKAKAGVTPTTPLTVTTKREAADAMKSIFTWSNSDLLNRPRVSGTALRAAGWTSFTGDYSTAYSIRRNVQLAGGENVEILWTPIMPDGTVLTPAQLNVYISKFGGDQQDVWVAWAVDWLWDHLILDVYTTEERGLLLQDLQAMYYAQGGSSLEPIVIDENNTRTSGSPIKYNTEDRYLPITNPNLRGRGLSDQFYKEYSYWVRNARIAKRTMKMELAQLRSIDKTKKVTIGDVTGFIKKLQYTVNNKTGLGLVTSEIMYL